MSLRFTLNGSERVESTVSTSSFPNTCTILSWIFPTTIDATYQVIVEKTPSDFSDYRGLGINGTTGEVAAFMRRGSPGFTGIEVKKAGVIVANKWQFVGAQMDASGTVAADQKIFYGLENGSVHELGSYDVQDPGSGATSPSSVTPLVVGNSTGSSYAEGFPGLIHCVGIWGRKMDISEIRYWKKMMQQGKFRPSANNTFFMYLGRNTGTQKDLSGNNFDGTITGALPVAAAPVNAERFFAPWASDGAGSPPPANNSGMFFEYA